MLPLSQLHVSLFARVLLGSARQLLGDDKLADVDAVAQKVRDDLFGVIHGTLRIPGGAEGELSECRLTPDWHKPEPIYSSTIFSGL